MTTITRWFSTHLLPKKWRDKLAGYSDGGYVAATTGRNDFRKPYPPSNPAYRAPTRPPPTPSPPLPRTATEKVVQIAVSDYKIIVLTSGGELFIRSIPSLTTEEWDLFYGPVITQEKDNEQK